MLHSTPDTRAVQNNLPPQRTSFVGREKQIEEVRALLTTSSLVTLVGAGGSGKTRLALQVAASLANSEEDGVWLVEMAGLSDPTFLYGEVARAVDVREEPGRPISSTLVKELEAKRLLLVLDHCEHLADACGSLADYLLRYCPNIHILATSREPLNVEGEQTYSVPSLPQSEALRLFTQRAQAAQPAFSVTSANASAVAQICLRLDGIPLALELAAARARSLPLEEISTQLDGQFRLQARGASRVPPLPQNVQAAVVMEENSEPLPPQTLRTLANRTYGLLFGKGRDVLANLASGASPETSPAPLTPQQTVETALDWTYELLTDGEQAFLNRLSVFAGGWILSAAAGVCVEGDGINRAVSDQEVLDLLMSLVDHSLVVYDAGGDGKQERFRLPEPVRQYAGERLSESGETEAIGGRASSWFMGLAELAAESLNRPGEEAWLSILETESGNLRASLAWEERWGGSEKERNPFEYAPRLESAVRLAAALWRFWYVQRYWAEGRRWLESALTRTIPETLGMRDPMEVWPATTARAKALYGAALLARAQGDREAEWKWQAQALTFCDQLGDQKGTAASLTSLGNTARMQGDYAKARGLHEASLRILRQIGDTLEIANVVSDLANAAHEQGDLKAARPLFEEALTLWRQLRDPGEIGTMLGNLGNVTSAEGDLPAAQALYEEAVVYYRQAGNTLWAANMLSNLGSNVFKQGDFAAARAYYEECLAIRRQLGDQRSTPALLNGLTSAASEQGDFAAARAFCEESLSFYRQSGDMQGTTSSLFSLGELAFEQGEYAASRAFYEECLPLMRQWGGSQEIADLLSGLGNAASEQGDSAAARAFFEEALTLHRQSADPQAIIAALFDLGRVASQQGDKAGARTFYEESLALERQEGDQQNIAILLNNLGSAAYYQGDYVGARAFYEEGLTVYQQLEDQQGVARILEGIAYVMQGESQP